MTLGPMNLLDAVSFHQLTLASEGRTEKTQRQYLYFERVFLRYLDTAGISPTLAALSPANVRAALDWYRAQNDYRRRRNGEVGAMVLVDTLKLFANFLEREDVVSDSPLRKMRRIKISKLLRQPFTHTEILAMWQACKTSPTPVRDEALFLMLLDTGMRIGEACTLRLGSVRLDERTITVGDEGKGRRERLVPIGQADKRDGGRTARAIRAYLQHRPESPRGRDRLFLGRDGFPLEAAGGSDVIVRLGKTAGVADAGPHRLRHSFASWYLTTNPGDEIGLRRIIGHCSPVVLRDYVHFAQTTLADRAGRASLAETLISPVVMRPTLQAIASMESRPQPKPRTASERADELLGQARTDPALREQLLRMLLADGAPADAKRKPGAAAS